MDAENVIVIVAQAILVPELVPKDAEMDVLTLVVVALIAALDVPEIVVEDVKRLAQLLVLNSVQELALWDALVSVIMVALAKKYIN